MLAAVIQNAIPQEVLPDALAACDASAVLKVSFGGIVKRPTWFKSFTRALGLEANDLK